jgi:plastocyanin
MRKISLVSFTLAAMFVAMGLMLFLSPCLAEQANSPSSTKTASVLIQSYAFSPSSLTVEKGTTVTWLNADRMVYKIKSDNFESPELNRGDAFSYTFNETGTYNYAEVSTPSMKGTIIVT